MTKKERVGSLRLKRNKSEACDQIEGVGLVPIRRAGATLTHPHSLSRTLTHSHSLSLSLTLTLTHAPAPLANRQRTTLHDFQDLTGRRCRLILPVTGAARERGGNNFNRFDRLLHWKWRTSRPEPPWRQPSKPMVSLVNSHTNATSRR